MLDKRIMGVRSVCSDFPPENSSDSHRHPCCRADERRAGLGGPGEWCSNARQVTGFALASRALVGPSMPLALGAIFEGSETSDGEGSRPRAGILHESNGP